VDSDELLGVFPIGNPIPYTGLVEVLHGGNTPLLRTWYHGTWGNRVASIAQYGLLPSCWFGGDCCCVFGFESQMFESYSKYSDWIVEIRSRVVANADLKAWWVPPSHIVGAWHERHFYPRQELLLLPGRHIDVRLTTPKCSDEACHIQYAVWQDTVLRQDVVLRSTAAPECQFPAAGE
jgi:hypothetical protein